MKITAQRIEIRHGKKDVKLIIHHYRGKTTVVLTPEQLKWITQRRKDDRD